MIMFDPFKFLCGLVVLVATFYGAKTIIAFAYVLHERGAI